MKKAFSSWLALFCLCLCVWLLPAARAAQVQAAQTPPANPAGTRAQQAPAAPNPAPAASSAAEAPAASPPAAGPAIPAVNLPLSVGDEVEISVYSLPDMSAHQRVDAAGDVYLPLINAVRIVGLTSEAAAALIEKRLRDGGFLKDPHVSLFVKQYAAGGIAILGEVRSPGIYPAAGPRHLWDLILAAGGTTERAGARALIRSQGKQESEAVKLVNPADPEAAMNSNVEVVPGDTIVVERAGVVYVLGEVKHSAAYVMEGDSMSVLQALAKAEGATGNAALNHATLVRQSASGPQRIALNLKDVLNAKAKDVSMRDGDMLYIPGRRGRYAAASTLQTILGIATGVAVRAY